MKTPKLKKLRIAKYTTNIISYLSLAVGGSLWALSKNDWQLFMVIPERPQLLGAILTPLVIVGFGLLAFFKDQIVSHFKFPKGIRGAITLLSLSTIILLLGNIAIWIILSSGLYLILSIVNTLYFDPAINEELEIIKIKKAEQAKKEVTE